MKTRGAAMLACIAGSMFSAAAFAQPANDTCGVDQASFTIPGGGGTVNGDTTDATRDGAACAGTTGVDTYWYFTPSATGTYSLNLCSTVPSYDMVLSVHTGCPTSTGNSVACNDDDFSACGVLSNIASVALNSGTTYTIRVASYGTGRGPYTLVVNNLTIPGNCCAPDGSCILVTTGAAECPSGTIFTGGGTCSPNPCPQPPSNDQCSGAMMVSAGAPAATGSNSLATADAHSCIAGTNKGVWFDFTAAAAGTYQVDTNTSGFDTVLSVFDACNGNELGCDDDSGDGLQSLLLVPLAANQNIKILVSAFGAAGAGGNYALNVQSTIAGACCNDTNGACTTVTTGVCPTGATYQGDNSVCSPSPCPASGACCNDATGVCAVTIQAVCPSGSTYQGDGTLCSPNPCPQPPPPANDECTSAIALTVGAAPVNGNNFNSTQSVTATCTGSTEDVWYSFNAPAAGTFTVTADSDVGTLISISAFDACGGAEIACTAALVDPAVLDVTTSGGTVYVRVATFTPETNFTIQVVTTIAGACCNDTTGVCTTVTTGVCPTGATYQGDNSVCSPSPCAANGACCNDASGACSVTVQTACPSGSTYQGDGSTCSPNPCPQPPPPANDECTAAIALTANVPFSGNNAQATGDGFEGPGGACYTTSPDNFNQAVWFSFTAPTTNNYEVTVCGSAFDTVISVFEGTCAAFGSEIGCDDDTCDGLNPPGSGLASVIAAVPMTAGQTYLIRVASWGTGDGAYTISVNGDAGSANNVCCKGATCSLTTSANCAASGLAGATFVGTATACNVGSTSTPCCYADYNKVGGISVQDIFDFLNDWFASSNFADTGGDGSTAPDVQSIFDFLNAWFAGGC